ncbi:MlaC/ttg2D family ABC transporter substrate-binding protein [Luteimonas sp. JM171]|uniref:MlaC/ttg2D family ABC transporter substrate-binding protein n=1 Tax=Luteimonas sp. JM171 TaxID=1896164 RepID=UPI0008576316|nr:ABC transporter substrate-binding protein [Luteimonas sp. JM171]AOH35769.1 organic solvent ABC transporter [Luteimonas sp. JM171]
MKKRTLPLILASALLAAAPALVLAQSATTQSQATTQGTPSQLVLDNTQRILATLEQRRAEFQNDRAALEAFVTSEFEAMFDKDYAARQVLGRHGRGADDADIAYFADALASSLLRRYGSSLLDFNTRLQVRIVSENALPRGLGVRVASELLRQGGEPIPMTFLMRQSGGEWKVFDVQVEGVSFVSTFRRQFDNELQNKSIRQVADELRGGRVQVDAGI